MTYTKPALSLNDLHYLEKRYLQNKFRINKDGTIQITNHNLPKLKLEIIKTNNIDYPYLVSNQTKLIKARDIYDIAHSIHDFMIN